MELSLLKPIMRPADYSGQQGPRRAGGAAALVPGKLAASSRLWFISRRAVLHPPSCPSLNSQGAAPENRERGLRQPRPVRGDRPIRPFPASHRLFRQTLLVVAVHSKEPEPALKATRAFADS
jgi:hypothetical protein